MEVEEVKLAHLLGGSGSIHPWPPSLVIRVVNLALDILRASHIGPDNFNV